jgi:L-iditol 2-dehydrogenase
MKAVIIEKPGLYKVREVPDPVCPEGGLLINVLACGLCGSDLRTLRSGHHRVRLPFTIGHEVSGRVIETGKNYSGPWKPGHNLAISPVVYCNKCNFCQDGVFELCSGYLELAQAWPGGFSRYMAIPAEAVMNGTIQEIPEGTDPVHATIVEPLSSCVNAQEKGNVGLGDTVVIIGAGPIGTLHLQLARLRGARRVIVADIDEKRLEMIGEFNPDMVINPSETGLVEKVMEATGSHGADVVITANAVSHTLVQAVEMARKGGRILLFGGLPGDQSRPPVNMNIVHYNALHLIGTTIFAPRHNRIAMQLVVSGKIDAGKFITHIFSLEDFEEGARLALEGRARKVVFVNRS